MKRRVALLTIGQSPRVDITPEIRAHLGEGVEILEGGALDDLSWEEIEAHAPKTPQTTLVSRMKDGSEVRIDKGYVHKRLQQLVHDFEDQVDLIGLLCSATFPVFSSRRPLIVPYQLLYGFVSAIRFPGVIGLVVPAPDQIDSISKEFRELGTDVIGTALSPYAEAAHFGSSVRQLANQGVAAIVLDCFGYTLGMKRAAETISKKPVICVRSLFINALRELIG